MHKKYIRPYFAVFLGLAVLTVASSAFAQQLGGRDAYSFKVYGNPAYLNRAIAIEQVSDGFGNSYFSSTYLSSNTSNSIGA